MVFLTGSLSMKISHPSPLPSSKVLYLFGILSLLAVCLTTGCSGFHRAWENQAALTSTEDEGLSGLWAGKWESEKNGHHGTLRCLITQTGNQQYQAWYHAKYLKWFSYAYKVDMEAHLTEPNLITFQGKADLGFLAGGTYAYQGQVSNHVFQAIYRAKSDHGVFHMQRHIP